MKSGGLFIDVKLPEFKVGVEVDCDVAVSDRQQDKLGFHGDLFASNLGFGFDVVLKDDWVNPLGN